MKRLLLSTFIFLFLTQAATAVTIDKFGRINFSDTDVFLSNKPETVREVLLDPNAISGHTELIFHVIQNVDIARYSNALYVKRVLEHPICGIDVVIITAMVSPMRLPEIAKYPAGFELIRKIAFGEIGVSRDYKNLSTADARFALFDVLISKAEPNTALAREIVARSGPIEMGSLFGWGFDTVGAGFHALSVNLKLAKLAMTADPAKAKLFIEAISQAMNKMNTEKNNWRDRNFSEKFAAAKQGLSELQQNAPLSDDINEQKAIELMRSPDINRQADGLRIISDVKLPDLVTFEFLIEYANQNGPFANQVFDIIEANTEYARDFTNKGLSPDVFREILSTCLLTSHKISAVAAASVGNCSDVS